MALKMGWFTVAVHLVVLIFGFAVGARTFRAVDDERERLRAAAMCFMAFNIAYVMTVGNLFEIGESNRYRFMIEPFVVVMFGCFLSAILARKKGQDARPRIRANAAGI
jgi:hypothetical protein